MLPSIHNLRNAWKLVKWDLKNRAFVEHAYEARVIESNLEKWLQDSDSDLANGKYYPQHCQYCDIPKGKFLIRPGARLELKDHLIYCALVDLIYEPIYTYLTRKRILHDYAYVLQKPGGLPWFTTKFGGWKGFERKSIEIIDEGYKFVVFTDISGFYDNVDLNRLRHMLIGLNVDQEILEMLFRSLWRWSEPSGRGVPQGLSSSDLLAKLYLDSVDRSIERAGFRHIRYVDDFRIFCKSRIDAQRALMALTRFLRDRGLSVQSAKTIILYDDDARKEIEGVIPSIERLITAVREIKIFDRERDPYGRVIRRPRFVDEGVAKDVLEQAFYQHFLESAGIGYDPSLLRYLLRRLGPLNSSIAIEYAKGLLNTHPEETQDALRYLAFFKHDITVIESIIRYAVSDEAIFDYQLYLILNWLVNNSIVSETALDFAHQIAAESGRPSWLRTAAIQVLGEFGNDADLEFLEEIYSNLQIGAERAATLCALRKMGKSRRNAVYSRYEHEGGLTDFAIRWARRKVG